MDETIFVVLTATWFVFSTIATINRFFCTNDNHIIEQCTKNKIVIINDNIIQCNVLDKKVLSGSE